MSERRPSPPLPERLFQGYTEEQFIVLAYIPQPGWWKRVDSYRDLLSAQGLADAYNDDGYAVIVCRQVVRYEPMEPITGASGATAQKGSS